MEDNVLGALKEDTKIQKRAADFVKKECGEYKNITVTGHSKGGNLSQYVTVTCQEQIDRCVSFDGQGFGKNFIAKYSDEIDMARDKITCINGYNDFVNILLAPIGGTYLFVHNQGGIGVDMHSCYTILSNGIFDENGDFDRTDGVRAPAMEIVLAKAAIDKIMNRIDNSPDYMREDVIGLLGTYVAAFFSNNMGAEYERERIEGALNELQESVDKMNEVDSIEENGQKYYCDFLYINIENVKKCYLQMEAISDEMRIYPVILEDVLVNLEINIRGISFTEIALKKLIAKLDKNISMIDKLKNILGEIITCYEKADVAA